MAHSFSLSFSFTGYSLSDSRQSTADGCNRYLDRYLDHLHSTSFADVYHPATNPLRRQSAQPRDRVRVVLHRGLADCIRPCVLFGVHSLRAVRATHSDRVDGIPAHLSEAKAPASGGHGQREARRSETRAGAGTWPADATHQLSADQHCANLWRFLATTQSVQSVRRPVRALDHAGHYGGVRNLSHGWHELGLLQSTAVRLVE